MLKGLFGNTKDRLAGNLASARDAALSTCAAAKESAFATYAASSKGAEAWFSQYWPAVQRTVLDALIGVSEDHLNDPATLTAAFETAYATLPLAARLAVRQDAFIAFCFGQLGSLNARLVEYRDDASSVALLADARCPESSPDLDMELADLQHAGGAGNFLLGERGACDGGAAPGGQGIVGGKARR